MYDLYFFMRAHLFNEEFKNKNNLRINYDCILIGSSKDCGFDSEGTRHTDTMYDTVYKGRQSLEKS